jgi:hypothetical protein
MQLQMAFGGILLVCRVHVSNAQAKRLVDAGPVTSL